MKGVQNWSFKYKNNFYYYILLYFTFIFIFSIITESQIDKILLGMNRNDSNCVKRDILCCIIQYKEFSHDKTTDTDSNAHFCFATEASSYNSKVETDEKKNLTESCWLQLEDFKMFVESVLVNIFTCKFCHYTQISCSLSYVWIKDS